MCLSPPPHPPPPALPCAAHCVLVFPLSLFLVRFELVTRMGNTIATLPDSTARLRKGRPPRTLPPCMSLGRHWRAAPVLSEYTEARPCLIVLWLRACTRVCVCQCRLLIYWTLSFRDASGQTVLCRNMCHPSHANTLAVQLAVSLHQSSCAPVSCTVPMWFAARALQ